MVDDEGVSLVADGEASIQILKDIDPGAGIADTLGARGNA